MYNYTIEALKAISRVVANESWERKQVYGGDNSRRKNLEMGKKGRKSKAEAKMIQINGGKLNIGKNL